MTLRPKSSILQDAIEFNINRKYHIEGLYMGYKSDPDDLVPFLDLYTCVQIRWQFLQELIPTKCVQALTNKHTCTNIQTCIHWHLDVTDIHTFDDF